jgi:membrane associated rhomboid family serine protease
MGIYDRDYYRREGPSYLGSFLERGLVCKWLIGINIVLFVLQMLTRVADAHGHVGDGFITDALILNVDKVIHGQAWRLLTHAFLHSVSDPYHIIFNMLALWWFGTDVEDLYGPREFLGFYLVAALAGGVLYTATTWAMGPPYGPGAVGASGAITAVLVLCAIHFPTRMVRVFFLVPVPIWLFVVGSVGLDLYVLLAQMGRAPGAVPAFKIGVAVAGHLGGAAFALAYYKSGIRITSLLPSLRDWTRRRSASRLRVYREDEEESRSQPVSVAAPSTPPASLLDDEQLEAKMDAVLEKISRVGKENLTDSEREVLLKASELLKKRRS